MSLSKQGIPNVKLTWIPYVVKHQCFGDHLYPLCHVRSSCQHLFPSKRDSAIPRYFFLGAFPTAITDTKGHGDAFSWWQQGCGSTATAPMDEIWMPNQRTTGN